MGCKNSKDGADPDKGTIRGDESFRDLNLDDKMRIARVLEYWFNDKISATGDKVKTQKPRKSFNISPANDGMLIVSEPEDEESEAQKDSAPQNIIQENDHVSSNPIEEESKSSKNKDDDIR